MLERLQPLGVRYLHAAELGFPCVKRRAADPVLAAYLSGRDPRLLLPQHRNNLLFREPRSLHGPVLPSDRTLAPLGGNRGGHSSIAEDSCPFTEAEVRRDDDAGALVELAQQVEQQRAAGGAERQRT